jgi:hypothetical protein
MVMKKDLPGCRSFDGRLNAGIGATTTDVAVHGGFDFRITGIGISIK